MIVTASNVMLAKQPPGLIVTTIVPRSASSGHQRNAHCCRNQLSNGAIGSLVAHHQPCTFCYVIMNQMLLAGNTVHTPASLPSVPRDSRPSRSEDDPFLVGSPCPPSASTSTVSKTRKLSVLGHVKSSAPDHRQGSSVCHFRDPLFS